MPFLTQIKINNKLVCIYLYKSMDIMKSHSRGIIGYTIKQKYRPFFEIRKIGNMEFNQYRYVFNFLKKKKKKKFKI
jgi:hypothetical protein